MEKTARIFKTIWLVVVLISITGIFMLLLVQIFSRYVINVPVLGTDEIAMLLFIWVVFIGAIAVVERDEMIRMNILSRFLPERIRYYLEIIFNLMFIAICITILPAAFRLVKGSWRYRFNITGIPWSFLYLAGLLFFASSAVLCTQKVFFSLRKKREHASCDSPGEESL
jgi:TRAP-type C4-dicarboxylate transport system permease small subunit